MSTLVEIVTVIGLPLAVLQLWRARVQERASFEQQFVARYWAIEDAKLMEKEVLGIHRLRYFRLTEDQFELMRLGQISWSTWEVWHDGIVHGARDFDAARHGEHRWLSTCRSADPHLGHDCPSLMEEDRAARHRSGLSPARHWQKMRRAWWSVRSGRQES